VDRTAFRRRESEVTRASIVDHLTPDLIEVV
jgi:hypothetical protein